MKFVVSLIFIILVCIGIYLFHTHVVPHTKNAKNLKKIKKRATIISAFVGLVLFGLLLFAVYKTNTTYDSWCTTVHRTTSASPVKPKTAMDYFLLGNYDFDTGSCIKAIQDYTKSISLNSKYPQSYNNRAYTFMRIRDYTDALTDLNKAISLDPNYIQALMNRGDIHNYYYEVDKESAVTDYKKVISLGGEKETSLCGHLFLAEHNGWNLGTILSLPSVFFGCK